MPCMLNYCTDILFVRSAVFAQHCSISASHLMKVMLSLTVTFSEEILAKCIIVTM